MDILPVAAREGLRLMADSQLPAEPILEYSVLASEKGGIDFDAAKKQLDEYAEQCAKSAGKNIVSREYVHLPVTAEMQEANVLPMNAYVGMKWRM